MKKALLTGNTDGIGLATTKRLLEIGWNVVGISRSKSTISNPQYKHYVADVRSREYSTCLENTLSEHSFDLAIYFSGIGELLDFEKMEKEIEIFEVNLLGMIKTTSAIIPQMVKRGKGHFIGISSLADVLVSAEAPSYNASKAGFSNYLAGLGKAVKPQGVFVTNVRFGFVDTKMAQGKHKPFMMTKEKAVEHLLKCMDKKPLEYSAPLRALPLVRLLKLFS